MRQLLVLFGVLLLLAGAAAPARAVASREEAVQLVQSDVAFYTALSTRGNCTSSSTTSMRPCWRTPTPSWWGRT